VVVGDAVGKTVGTGAHAVAMKSATRSLITESPYRAPRAIDNPSIKPLGRANAVPRARRRWHMPRSEGGSATDQPTTQQQTETERVIDQRRGERGGQDATSTTSTRTYTVKSGDTLSDIAQSEMGDANRWPELYAANKDAVGKNPDMIHPGLELTIPA
jgi:nucleoid-associated protein YgaU